jgi:hypothetical protein
MLSCPSSHDVVLKLPLIMLLLGMHRISGWPVIQTFLGSGIRLVI